MLKNLSIRLAFAWMLFAFITLNSIVAKEASALDTEILMLGKTTPVLLNGVNNAGTIWFQNDGAVTYLPTDPAQRVHLVEIAGSPGTYELRGWAWSDNLGWISFSCDENTHLNSGAACGDFAYATKIDVDGNFSGWAWNDAMGWISMSYKNEHNPPLAAGIEYGPKMDDSGDITGYAWSPSLGWINFAGTYAIIDILNKIEPDCDQLGEPYVGACAIIGPDPEDQGGGGGGVDYESVWDPALDPDHSDALVVADGYDKYTIKLFFRDENGTTLTQSDFTTGKYEAEILFVWEDKVLRNQTSTTNATSELAAIRSKTKNPFSLSEANGGGAITDKPVYLYSGVDLIGLGSDIVATSKENIESTPSIWESDKVIRYVKSVAPTSNANLSKRVSRNGYIENDDLSTLPESIQNLLQAPKSSLKLSEIKWAIKNTQTGRIIRGRTPYDNTKTGNFMFKPALELSTLTNEGSGSASVTGTVQDFIEMYRNVPVKLKMQTRSNKTGGTFVYNTQDAIQAQTTLTIEGGSEFDVKFLEEPIINQPEAKIQSDGENGKWVKTELLNLINNPFYPQINASLPATPKESLPGNYSEGIGLWSKIEYWVMSSGKNWQITYYSNHLPRVVSGSIKNPAVEVLGTTYSQGQKIYSVQEGINITGVGDRNVNIVRDFIYENIQKLLIDKEEPQRKDSFSISSYSETCKEANGCLVLLDNANEKILYINAKEVVIDKDTTDLPLSKNIVIIVKNGNIHINRNLYTAQNPNQYRLGIIALREKDLSQGNIYISPEVTNIQATIIADGTVFSAKEDSAINEYGEPEEIAPQDFKNQLIIEGGVSSRNCIGCVDGATAFYSIPRDPLMEKTEENQYIAKKYDLNYLRYFAMELEYDEAGDVIDQSCGKAITADDYESDPLCDGIDATRAAPDGDLILKEGVEKAKGAKESQMNPVYIKYIPPSEKSQIFTQQKNLTF